MKITIAFGNKFQDMMRAKLRWFCRRSLLRYVIAVAMITYGLHGFDSRMNRQEIVTRGIAYYIVLCVGVLLMHVLAAFIQSRKVQPREITFSEDDLQVNHKGEVTNPGWGYIVSARETATLLCLLVQTRPRLELYVPKMKLPTAQYEVLLRWLEAHDKLSH